MAALGAAFADRNLGKQVVFANDTPNFIANRHRRGRHVQRRFVDAGKSVFPTIEEVDALTGPAYWLAAHWQLSGWPTWRDRDSGAWWLPIFRRGVTPGGLSSVLAEIVKRGWLGDKAGQGFYKKAAALGTCKGMSAWCSNRRPSSTVRSAKFALPALEMAEERRDHYQEKDCGCCWSMIRAKDKAADFLWPFLAARCEFCCRPHHGDGGRCALSIEPAPCGPDSIGRWARLRCGMRRELSPLSPA